MTGRSAHDPARIPGGSSGGTGAAIAAGLAAAYNVPLTAVHVAAPGSGPGRRGDLERSVGEQVTEVVPTDVPFRMAVTEGRPAASLVE